MQGTRAQFQGSGPAYPPRFLAGSLLGYIDPIPPTTIGLVEQPASFTLGAGVSFDTINGARVFKATRGDGNIVWLTTSGSWSLPIWVAGLILPFGGTDSGDIWDGGNSGNSMRLARFGDGNLTMYSGGYGPAVPVPTQASFIEALYASGSSASWLRVNRGSQVTGTIGSATLGGITLAQFGGGGGNQASCKYGPIAVCQGYPGDMLRDRFYDYVAARYGL